jgi:6-phospho-3-hexuloisomerase
MNDDNTLKPEVDIILKEISAVFDAINYSQVQQLIAALLKSERVFIVGVGRVLLSMQALVKRLNHLGIKAYYVGQIDEPAATVDDFLIVASNSGESIFPVGVAAKAKKIGMTIAYIGSKADSTAGKLADIMVLIPVSSKPLVGKTDDSYEIKSQQPMTSLFEQVLLLLGDAISMGVIKANSDSQADYWTFHANLE